LAIESWIDEITKLWEIDDGRGGTVKSFRVFEVAEFPEAIEFTPCAITYPTDVTSQYSLGGPLIDYWQGQTEFHLFDNASKANIPEAIRFIARIRNAAAGSMKLNGTVDHFLLRGEEGASVEGPVALSYGGADEPRLGFIVYWNVKENVTGDYTPSI